MPIKPGVAAPDAKVRIPNAERTARTREKLILTTIECLYELGYHQTSTQLVTKRAGVSRGGMLHQFPTKADLMIATSEYIRELRGAAFRAGLAGIEDPRIRLGKNVDILWEQLTSPSGLARIEIMLASRSDPEFGARFDALNKDLEQSHKDVFWVQAQRLGITDRRLSDDMVLLYAAALRGLAIDALNRPAGELDGAVELLKTYHTLLLDHLAATAKSPKGKGGKAG